MAIQEIHIHVHCHHGGCVDHTEQLERMERLIMTATDNLTELKTDLVDVFADIDAKLDRLIAAQGDLNPEAQEVFDEIKGIVAAKDAEIGDEDGSDTPVDPEA